MFVATRIFMRWISFCCLLFAVGCFNSNGSGTEPSDGGAIDTPDVGCACAPPNAEARCEGSECVLDHCEDGFTDCDGIAENGCEVRGASCEACEASCEPGARCVEGTCRPFQTVSVAAAHACALRFDGSVECWGVSSLNPSSEDVHGLVDDEGAPIAAKDIAVGPRRVCFIALDGKLHCMGNTRTHVLANDPARLAPRPVESDAPSFESRRFVAIQTSGAWYNDMTCALDEAGSVWCWGRPFGDRASRVPGSADVQQFALSSGFVCMLIDGGRIVCHGARFGGSFETFSLERGDFETLIRGEETCAIATNGDLVCWWAWLHPNHEARLVAENVDTAWLHGTTPCWRHPGSSEVRCEDGYDFGRWFATGEGQPTFSDPQTMDDSRLGSLRDVDVVATNRGVGCGYDSASRLVCWGDARGGVVPNPSAFEEVPAPVLDHEGARLQNVQQIVGGGNQHRFCALSDTQQVLCWGSNINAVPRVLHQASNATHVNQAANVILVTTNDPTTPLVLYGSHPHVPFDGTSDYGHYAISDPGFPRVRSAIIGESSDGCVLTSGDEIAPADEVWCWGFPTLSWGGEIDEITPVHRFTEDGIGPRLDQVVQLGAYFSGTMCALREDGALYCWGGPLTGRDDDEYLPGIATLTDAVHFALGSQHACAVTNDGGVRCWGENEHGQVLGRRGPQLQVAQRVDGIEGATHVAVGWGFSCARTRDGSVWCWGRNDRFQHGRGVADTLVSPHRVAIEGVTSLVNFAQSSSMCALVEGGEVHCWGASAVGIGTNPDVFLTPRRVEFD